jgi:hypothetical protein
MVPVFKQLTHLPPYMGILLGLGILWIITEIIHGKKDEEDKKAGKVMSSLIRNAKMSRLRRKQQCSNH